MPKVALFFLILSFLQHFKIQTSNSEDSVSWLQEQPDVSKSSLVCRVLPKLMNHVADACVPGFESDPGLSVWSWFSPVGTSALFHSPEQQDGWNGDCKWSRCEYWLVSVCVDPATNWWLVPGVPRLRPQMAGIGLHILNHFVAVDIFFIAVGENELRRSSHETALLSYFWSGVVLLAARDVTQVCPLKRITTKTTTNKHPIRHNFTALYFSFRKPRRLVNSWSVCCRRNNMWPVSHHTVFPNIGALEGRRSAVNNFQYTVHLNAVL